MNKILAVVLAVAVFFLMGSYGLKTYAEIAALVSNPYEDSVEEQQGKARELLDENLRQLYDRVKTSLLNYESEALVRRYSYDEDDLKAVLWCIMQDSPEIFWIDWTSWAYTERPDGFTLRPTYLFSSSLIDQKRKDLDQACDALIARMAEEGITSDYDIMLFLHDYLIDHVTYEKDGPPDVHSAYGAIVDGIAVCDGYAHALQLILNRMGKECYYVEGYTTTSSEDEGHAWNIVNIDGNYHAIDITWDDIERMATGEEFLLKSYCYFLISDAEMEVDHVGTNPFPLPECVSYDYMSKQGLSGASFEDIREEAIDEAVRNILAGNYYLEFVITDEEAYEAFYSNEDSVVGMYLVELNEALVAEDSDIVIERASCDRMIRGFLTVAFLME
jgi:hypothetical protein